MTVEQTSGSPRSVPSVADGDLDAARNFAVAALSDEAEHELTRRYGSDWMFFPETADVQVSEVKTAQKAGASTALLEVTYRGNVSMLGTRSSAPALISHDEDWA